MNKNNSKANPKNVQIRREMQFLFRFFFCYFADSLNLLPCFELFVVGIIIIFSLCPTAAAAIIITTTTATTVATITTSQPC